jgi:predicted glycosyltransferase
VSTTVKIWIDIDNPPQVQYLSPFVSAFEAQGADTVLTARDYGPTVAMLEMAGADVKVFGTRVGRGRLRKVRAGVARARALSRLFAAEGRPDALVAASRPAALAARRLGVPSFIIDDYEYANVTAYRLTRSTVLHPEAIDPAVFRQRGLRAGQLVAFRGFKEDLTFRDVDVAAVEPHALGAPDGAVRVLFRPPSETSHYYRPESRSLALAALDHLAHAGVVVVFSPREPAQIAYLEGREWAHAPVVLERPVPFVALLKSIDAVVCAGGTMLREAAYLGVPAYSIFQGDIGGVDRRLEALGRITVIDGEDDLPRLEVGPRGPLDPLAGNPALLEELVSLVLSHVHARGRRPLARRLEPILRPEGERG